MRSIGLLAVLLAAAFGCEQERPASERAAPAADCAHGLTRDVCPKCTPALAAVYEAKGDWCDEHGFPESFCPICRPGARPDVNTEKGDWCPEHGVPESKCTKCNPDLIVDFKEAGDWCGAHGFPESVCPICNRPPGTPVPSAIEPGTKIKFLSGEIERAAGIGVTPARAASLGVGVECTARLSFDQNRVADVRAPVSGVVQEVLVDLGQAVEVGTPLFLLESARVGELQGQVRAARQRVEVARANFNRQKELRQADISSARQLELARQELEAAEAELNALDSGLRIAGASGKSGRGRYLLRAPKKGTVVRRPATVGTFATEEISLATLADTASMWALLEVREADASVLEAGQRVVLRVDGLQGRTFTGQITWIASEVDPRTRTVAARAEVPNPDRLLRANQFAEATIDVAAPKNAVTVPRRSVQRLGEERVVFVRIDERTYEPRVVTLGRSTKELVEVTGEVAAGDAVATDGAFLLKTELSKENIGAGCCEVEGPKK